MISFCGRGSEGYDALEVADFADECARSDDSEAREQAPDETAQDSDDFMAE